MQYDLGYFDTESCRLEPIENPFAAKVLPIWSEESPVTHVPGIHLECLVARGGMERQLRWLTLCASVAAARLG